MSNPLFNALGAQPRQDNDPQFMRMVTGLNKFRSQLQGDPEQMVMEAVRSGRISQQQLDRVQDMATKIQRMMTGMGL